MTEELHVSELGWLLGLASARRRKREHELANFKRRDGQTHAEYQAAKTRQARTVEWARGVEDHLILLIAEVDRGELRDHHAARLRDLERRAA